MLSMHHTTGNSPPLTTVRTPPGPAWVIHYQGDRQVWADPHGYSEHEPIDARCPGCTTQPVCVIAAGTTTFRVLHQAHCKVAPRLAGRG